MKDPLTEGHLPPDVALHDRLRAVIKQLTWDATKVGERLAVTRPERHEILRARQRAERIPRVAEHHVKAVERELQPRSRADRLLVRPVDLRLVPGRRLEPLTGPRRTPWTGPLGIAAHRVIAAREAIVAHQILVDARRQQTRLRGQPLIDQRLELIQLRRCAPALIDGLSTMLQIALHGPPITTQHPADLGIGQPLTLQRPDIHQLLLADHRDLQLDDIQAVSLKAVSDSAPDPPPGPMGTPPSEPLASPPRRPSGAPRQAGDTPTLFNAHPPALLGADRQLRECLWVLRAVLLTEYLERVFGVLAGRRLDDLAQEPLRAWLQALGERVDHVPRSMEPAALLARAGEHVSERGPCPERAITDDELRLVQPTTLEIAKHAGPALGRLAVAILDREELLDAVLPDTDHDQQTHLGILAETHLDVDPVHEQVRVAAEREQPLTEPVVVSLPLLAQPADRRGRQAGGILAEQALQRRTEIPG